MRFSPEGSMTELHTSVALLDALKKGTSRYPRREQLEDQRLSFVMGSLDEDNHMTREQVKSELEKQEGRALKVK
jgi:hypothetical protein